MVQPDRLYEGYVFDLDGTIYLGDELLPGAERLILKLRELGKRVIFLSNNPTKDPKMYAEKLGKLGLETPASEIVNTVVTMTEWLLQHHPDATVFPISEEPLKNSLEEAGIRMSEDPEEIDIVIASYDRGFEYRKLQIAFDAIWFHGRAMLVTTNPDRYCPFPGGRGEPDAAAIVGAIEASTVLLAASTEIPAISSAGTPLSSIAPCTASTSEDHHSSGSCSAQPGRGCCHENSRSVKTTGVPSGSKIPTLAPPVPKSMPMR